MKKALLLSCCVCAAAASYCQQPAPPYKEQEPEVLVRPEPRFTVNIHTGYATALGSTFRFYPDDISSIRMEMRDNTVTAKSVKYGSPKKGLGEGFRVGAGFSYVINDFINAGLDVDYFRSTIRKDRDSTSNRSFSSGTLTASTFSEHVSISYDALLLSFTPNITFKAISRPKWFLYNKIGMVITLRPNSIQNDRRDVKSSMSWQGFTKDSSYSSETRYEWGIRNPSLGFMGAVGAQYKITERIRLFSEIQFSHIVFVIRKRTTTNMVTNGKDIVSTLPRSEREIEFETSFRQDSWIPDPNKPSRAVTQRIPITFLGLQAGVAYRF